MSQASQPGTPHDGLPPERTPQVGAEVVANRLVGAYHLLSFVAAGVAERAAPGQFVALAVGGDTSANLLRRCFSIHNVSSVQQVSPSGVVGGTVDLVVAARGPGTRWLTDLTVGDTTNLIGPLGRGFVPPTDPTPCVLVGGGYGSAPLFWMATQLRERGCHVEMVLGAATRERLFGLAEANGARRAQEGVTVTTDDGSAGTKGWVSDVLPDVIARSGARVVYGCGPMAMLRSITAVATAHNATAQVAVEESMACGIGVCMTCVMPVSGDDGVTRMARSCVEGPVFGGNQIRWDAYDSGWCQVPLDAHGAAAMSAH